MERRDAEPESWTADGAYSDTQVNAPRFLTIVASKGDPVDLAGECFHSVTVDGNFLTVTDATSQEHGEQIITEAMTKPQSTSAMLALVSRDYGMFERAEAPQYFPDVKANRAG